MLKTTELTMSAFNKIYIHINLINAFDRFISISVLTGVIVLSKLAQKFPLGSIKFYLILSYLILNSRCAVIL